MRSAEWLGEVVQRGRRRVRVSTDLPLKFRIPHSALRIRPWRPPARRRTPSAALHRIGEGAEQASRHPRHHRSLRCAVRRPPARAARDASRPHLAHDLEPRLAAPHRGVRHQDRKSTRLNSSHGYISYAVFCLKKKKKKKDIKTENI